MAVSSERVIGTWIEGSRGTTLLVEARFKSRASEGIPMSIGELARRAGVSTSAVRYYERVGLLPVPARSNGRRSYGGDALSRLAVILHARRIGFSIAETRQLTTLFPLASPASRWKALAAAKLEAMDAMIAHAQAMKTMLHLISECRCDSWDQCGNALLAKLGSPAPSASSVVGD
jgi:MerR family redox-sensitive transcriptional activator SoxR